MIGKFDQAFALIGSASVNNLPLLGQDRFDKAVHNEIRIATDGRSEMRVTGKRKTKVTQVVDTIDGLRQTSQRHHLNLFGIFSVGVASFGIFVRLTEQFVEGLVHISNLPPDYYIFDAAAQRLTGERTRQTFTLGDDVTVRVTNVDLEQRHIDFELTGHQRSKKQRNSKSKKASTKTKSKSQITKGKSKPKKTKSVKRARSRRKK
jgi:ribonuclease R